MSSLPSRSYPRARSAPSVKADMVLVAGLALLLRRRRLRSPRRAPRRRRTSRRQRHSVGSERAAGLEKRLADAGCAQPRAGRRASRGKRSALPPRQRESCHHRSPPPRRLRRGAALRLRHRRLLPRQQGLLPGPPARPHPGRRARLLRHRAPRRCPISSSSAAPAPSSKAPSPTSSTSSIVPDFGQGTALLYDAYIDLRPWRCVALRVGKFKTPFGLERLQNDAYMAFIERGLPSGPRARPRHRRVAARRSRRRHLLYGSSASSTAPLDDNSANQTATPTTARTASSRIFTHPLRPLRSDQVRDLGVGIAATYGKQHGTPRSPASGRATRRPGRTPSSRTSSTRPRSSRR